MTTTAILEQLGITKEDLTNQVIDRILCELEQHTDFYVGIEAMARDRCREYLESKVEKEVSDRLTSEMEKILSQKVQPIDIFGDKAGEMTTIRDALAVRAKNFWQESVDEKGSPTKWGGKPRYQKLMSELMNEEFSKAIRENATAVVAGFKAAVKSDLAKLCNEHIEKLIPSRR